MMYCCICKENSDIVYTMDKGSKSILGLNPYISASICKHCIASANKHISIKNECLVLNEKKICILDNKEKNENLMGKKFIHKDGGEYVVIAVRKLILSDGVNYRLVEYKKKNINTLYVRTEEHFLSSFKEDL